MWERYGKIIAGILIGAVIVWGLNGFKNPFSKSLNDNEKLCSILSGIKTGFLQSGISPENPNLKSIDNLIGNSCKG